MVQAGRRLQATSQALNRAQSMGQGYNPIRSHWGRRLLHFSPHNLHLLCYQAGQPGTQRDLPGSYPAQSSSLVWGSGHTPDESLIWGFLSGSCACSWHLLWGCTVLRKREAQEVWWWTGLLEVELSLCLTCLCYTKGEVWFSVHGHFLSRHPRAQARAMSQKHVDKG